MRQKLEFIASVGILLLLILLSRNVSKMAESVQVEARKECIVIDAGHGGSDPGKVGVNELKEKDINLAIAKKVKTMLEKKKITVYMTREEDEIKHLKGGSKVEDMKRRVELINEKKPVLAVSIHQNSYHDEEISGAQVFYYTHSEEGKEAADILQQALLTVDAKNHRQAKANDTYYLLKRTEAPTIIIECGFLSNWEEAELLKDEDYQQKLAEVIANGIMTCVEKNR